MRVVTALVSLIMACLALPSAPAHDSSRFIYVGPTGTPYLTISIDGDGNITILRGHVALDTGPCSSEDMLICTGNFFLPVSIPLDLADRREWEYGYFSYRRSEAATAVSIWGQRHCIYVITTVPRAEWQNGPAAQGTWTFLFSKEAGLLMASKNERDGSLTQLFYSQDAKGWGGYVVATPQLAAARRILTGDNDSQIVLEFRRA